MEVLRHLLIDADATDRAEELDRGNIRTETAPHRAELQPDHAGTDQTEPARHCLQLQGAGRRNDRLLVHLDAREGRHLRAGRDQDVLRVDRLLATVRLLGDDRVRAGDRAEAVDVRDFVLFEQLRDTAGQRFDRLRLLAHQHVQVEPHVLHVDAAGRQVARVGHMVVVRVVQQRFRRDAAHVQAGAAERVVLFNAHSLMRKGWGREKERKSWVLEESNGDYAAVDKEMTKVPVGYVAKHLTFAVVVYF